jgi:hypothetical protein
MNECLNLELVAGGDIAVEDPSFGRIWTDLDGGVNGMRDISAPLIGMFYNDKLYGVS